MRIQSAVALVAGVIVVAAFGGIAAAQETDEVEIGVETPTPEPSETVEDDVESDDKVGDEVGDGASGLVCVLVPIEDAVDDEGAPLESEEGVTTTIAELLAANDIECTGTGNERSAAVALVPRFLAHSDLFTGAEKGAAISEWAKSKSNKPVVDEDDGDGEVEVQVESESQQRGNGSAPGQSGDHPGKGGGKGGPKR